MLYLPHLLHCIRCLAPPFADFMPFSTTSRSSNEIFLLPMLSPSMTTSDPSSFSTVNLLYSSGSFRYSSLYTLSLPYISRLLLNILYFYHMHVRIVFSLCPPSQLNILLMFTGCLSIEILTRIISFRIASNKEVVSFIYECLVRMKCCIYCIISWITYWSCW